MSEAGKQFTFDRMKSSAANRSIALGIAILTVPDPIPVVDEVIGTGLILGGLSYHLVSNLPYGGVSSYPSQSAITSTTGHSVRKSRKGGGATATSGKKQMRSTSQSYSRRKYYYGKKRKYRY